MMHKEVVARKRTHVIVMTLFLITVMLYIYQGIAVLEINNDLLIFICNATVILFTIAFIISEYVSCIISYKYVIIADKFIINRLYRGSEENLESIKIENILNIGKRNSIPKQYKVKCSGKYICDIIGHDIMYCIYLKDGKLSMFNFEPSEDLLTRISRCNSK